LHDHSAALSNQGKIKHDITTWIRENVWLEGRPFSFEASGPRIEYGDHDIPSDRLFRPYLPQILNDRSPIRSIIKPRQSELTTNHINEHLFYLCTRPHTRISHIFPSDPLSEDVSREKVRPVIVDSPRILRAADGTGAVHNYTFKNGGIYQIIGSLKKAGGRAGSRDIISFDEYQFMPESIVGVYEKLLSHSALRLIRKVSTGETPLIGIDKAVKEGCEYVWEWKCEKCGKWQTFTWPDSVINYFDPSYLDQESDEYKTKLKQVYWGCKYCKTYVNRNSLYYISNSRWNPRRPGLVGINSSYYMTIAQIPWKNACEILSTYHKLRDYPATFMNEDWGEAYIKGEARLNMGDLKRCQRQWEMPTERTRAMSQVVMGIDHGERSSWVVVMARGFDELEPRMYCIVYIEEISKESLSRHGFRRFSGLEHTRRCKQLIQQWQPQVVLTDSNGLGSDRSVSIVRSYSRQAWGVFYDTAEKTRTAHQSKLLTPRFEEKKRIVTISKLQTLKQFISEVRRRQWAFPATRGDHAETVRTYLYHLTALGVQPRYDLILEREYEAVVKLHTEDHLADCTLYSLASRFKLEGFKSKKPGVV